MDPMKNAGFPVSVSASRKPKGPKVIRDITITPAKNGGATVQVSYKQPSGPGYHESDTLAYETVEAACEKAAQLLGATDTNGDGI